VELYRAGRAVPLPGRRQVTLLAFLLCNRNRPVSTDQIVDALWPGVTAAGAVKRVHVTVARLRKVLDPVAERLSMRTLAGGYLLETQPEDVDADVLGARVDLARLRAAAGDHAGALAALDDGLALWRGPPFADVAFLDFAQPDIRALEELRLTALEMRAEHGLALGLHAEVIGPLEALRMRDPTRERVTELLMQALYGAGRQVEALEVYRDLRHHLTTELGLEPGPRLRELELQVLNHAPELRAPAASVPVLSAAAPAAARPVPPSLPPLLAAVGRRAFVGRPGELEALDHAFKDAASGQPAVVMVTGEPGIGKTALCARFAASARDRGAAVLYARCDPSPMLPYQPVTDALAEHLRRVGLPWGEAGWPADVAPARRLLPQLGDGSGSPPGEGASDYERFRLFDALRRLVASLAAQRPVVLIVDDVHWADPSVLALLRHLAGETEPCRFMLLGAYRDTELADDHPLTAWCAESRARAVERIALTGLRPDESARLIVTYLGDDQGPEAGRAWHERTEGHPLFLHELLRHAGDASGHVDLPLPGSVRQLVSSRVVGLGADARRTLRTAAVIGRDFALELAAAMCGLSVDAALLALEEALDRGLLVEVPDAVDRFAFSHALIREALYEEQSRSRRVRIHARVAEALEALGGSATELAYHFHESRMIGAPEKAVAYSARAGAQALEALAYEDAVGHYRRALVALDSVAGDAEDQRADLLIRLGEALMCAGAPSAEETLGQAAAIARSRRDPHRFAHAAIAGRHSEPGSHDEARIAVLAEALDGLGDEASPLRVEVLARLASALHVEDRDGRPLALSQDALDLARSLGDDRALLAALQGRHDALLHITHLDERLAVLRRIIDLAEQAGRRDLLAFGHHFSTYARLEEGDAAAARREAERFAALAGELRQPRLDHAELAWRSVFAQVEGRLGDAERLAHEGLRYDGRLDVADAFGLFASQLSFIRRDQDRLAELLAAVASLTRPTAAADAARVIGPWEAGLVAALAGAGDLPRARAALADAGSEGFDDVPRDLWWLSTISLLAEGCATARDVRHARTLRRMLEPHADRHVQVIFAAHLGSVHRFVGLLAEVCGDGAAAVEHLELALARHESAELPALVQRSRCELARLLKRSSREGDRRRAGGLLRSAVSDAAGTDLGPLVTRLAAEVPGDGRRDGEGALTSDAGRQSTASGT
jgi:DNA-binding SARP family transcriptional activator